MKFRKRFLLSMLAVLVIPLVTNSVLVFFSVNDREMSLRRQYVQSSVRQLRGSIDYVFSKIQSDFAFLTYRREIRDLKRWYETSDYREKRLFLDSFSSFSSLADYYDEAFLIHPDGIMIDLKNKTLLPVSLSNQAGKIAEFIDSFQRTDGARKLVISREEKGIYRTYLIDRIVVPEGHRNIYLSVRLSENFFRHVLDDVYLVDKSYLLIVDTEGRLISLRSKGLDLSREAVPTLYPATSAEGGFFWSGAGSRRYLVCSDVSPENQWKYYYGIDVAGVVAPIAEDLLRLAGLTLLLLVVFAFVVRLATKRLYEPFRHILEIFRGSGEVEGDDDLDELGERAERLIASHRDLEVSFDRSRLYEKQAFLKSLTSGQEDFPEEKVARLGLEIALEPDSVYLIAFAFSFRSEVQSEFRHAAQTASIVDFRRTWFSGAQAVRLERFLTDDGLIVLIVSSIAPSSEGAPSFVPAEGSGLTLAFSTEHRGLAGLKAAYREAVLAYDYRTLFPERSWFGYAELVDHQKKIFFYPFEAEQKLLSWLKQTQEPETFDALTIFAKTVRMTGVPLSTARRVYQHLIDSLAQVVKDFELSPSTFETEDEVAVGDAVDACAVLEDIEALIRNLTARLLQQLHKEKDSGSELLAKTVKRLIEENYQDYSLCLDSLAHELKYSTSHLSSIFRCAYGETIKDHITRVRLDRACDLLANTRKNVSKIAQDVGYLNLGSFVKIFKTYRGETPKSYKLRLSVGR